jgi:hypothetical protein
MAESGSRSSIGLVDGGTSCSAARCVPSPMRTRPKSSWLDRRSHSRGPIAVDHSDEGAGLFHNVARRWSSPTDLV